MEKIINVVNLTKKFAKKDSKKNIIAVNNLSFDIDKGEKVAFIGPNGAGKSTTIKMLSAILYPTSGSAKILGLTPWENSKKLAYDIGTVFGQRSQLWYQLPVEDSFHLLGTIYDIPEYPFKKRLLNLVKLFEIKDLLKQPTKSLSLGQRMRCEIVASLLHNPKILFLDEPTIGLDVTAKAILREVIKKQADKEETTLLLTSHDTDDMEKVCNRVIVINKGKLIFDDSVQKLRKSFLKKKYIEITESDGNKFKVEVDTSKQQIKDVLAELITKHQIFDMTIENPPMEEIIKEIYTRDE